MHRNTKETLGSLDEVTNQERHVDVGGEQQRCHEAMITFAGAEPC